MGLDPFKDLSVAFAGGQLLQKRFGIKTQEPDQVLVGAAVIIVFAVFLGKGRPALVEHARQQGVSAQPASRTARRTLGEVWGCDGWYGIAHTYVFILMVALFSMLAMAAPRQGEIGCSLRRITQRLPSPPPGPRRSSGDFRPAPASGAVALPPASSGDRSRGKTPPVSRWDWQTPRCPS